MTKRPDRRRLALSKETLRRLGEQSLTEDQLRFAAGGQAPVTDWTQGICAKIGDLTLNGCRGPTNMC